MAYARIEHAGGALSTTLATDISSGDTSLSLTAGSTWPTGSVGPFYLVIDPATSSEEKILATARTTNSLTGLTRGVDGTSAAAHGAGAIIKAVFTGVEADEANQIVKATLGTVAAKGDLLAGTGANALGKLTVGANSTIATADSTQTTGLKWSTIAAASIASGAVTLAKFGTGLRPVFPVADATALAALTPANGDIALQADTLRAYVYRNTQFGLLQTQVAQGTVTGGPTSSTTELTLCTLVVAAIPATYQIECAAYWSPTFSVAFDLFVFRIKVDGVEKASQAIRSEGAGSYLPLSLPTSTLTTIATNTSSTVTVTVQRTSGTGTADEIRPGKVTARLLPL